MLVGDPWGYGIRSMTEAIVIHHTTGTYSGPSWTRFWKSIANYHVNIRGWKCIAYQRGVASDGTRFQLVSDDAITPGVHRRNHRFVYVASLGDHSQIPPTDLALEGLRQHISELRAIYGNKPVLGHRQVALSSSPTSCPGDTYTSWLSQIQ